MEGILPSAWLVAKKRRLCPKRDPNYPLQLELRGGVRCIPRRRKSLRMIMRKRSRGLRMSKLRISVLSPLGFWRRLRDLYVRLSAKLSPCTSPTGAASRSRSSKGQGANPPAATALTEGSQQLIDRGRAT